MKNITILIVLVVILFGTLLDLNAEITNTEGEGKVGQGLKAIYSLAKRDSNNLNNLYNDVKNYVLAHPTQFTSSDKTKLTDFQQVILDAIDKLNDIETYVETEWPGLNE